MFVLKQRVSNVSLLYFLNKCLLYNILINNVYSAISNVFIAKFRSAKQAQTFIFLWESFITAVKTSLEIRIIWILLCNTRSCRWNIRSVFVWLSLTKTVLRINYAQTLISMQLCMNKLVSLKTVSQLMNIDLWLMRCMSAFESIFISLISENKRSASDVNRAFFTKLSGLMFSKRLHIVHGTFSRNV